MADSKYKIKGIEENDELLYIGSLFRHAYSADWHIQVRFKKSQKKSVLASLISELVVGRIYNPTSEVTFAKCDETFFWSKIVGNKSGIDLKLTSIAKAKRNERYFLVKDDYAYIAIPQLELARALFLQNSKMFHYALEPISLGIDFQSYSPDEENLIIEVSESAQLSKYQFERIFNLNKLSYTLADRQGRDSFLSISSNFLKYRFDTTGDRKQVSTWWKFGFDVPNLTGSVLDVSTYESTGVHKGEKVRVVREIHSINKVPHSLPENIQFFSKKWLRTLTGNTSDDGCAPISLVPEEYEIDDQQSANSFLPERIVHTQGCNEFSLGPSRQAKTLTAKSKIRVISDDAEYEISGSELASTEIPSLLGTATPVVTSTNTSDKQDESTFLAFKNMVNLVHQDISLNLPEYTVRKLHKVGLSRVHRKKVSKILRCAAVAHFRDESSLESYSLIEIDLSDYGSQKSLSTLLFKYSCLDEARLRVDAILSAFVANSLNWPRQYFLDNHIKAGFINHPSGLEMVTSEEIQALIQKWANSVISKIQNF